MHFIMHIADQQKYSSRQADITSGIVLACLIPILLAIIWVGYRALKSRKQQRENEEVLIKYRILFIVNSNMSFVHNCDYTAMIFFRTRQAELQRLQKIDKDEESIHYSPSKITEIRENFICQIFGNVELLYDIHISFLIVYL